MATTPRLAIQGGTPTLAKPFPTGPGGPGVAAMGLRELLAVWRVIRTRQHFRFHPHSEVLRFEHDAAKYIGVKHAHMVNSGTSALICALSAAGLGPGDEVIVPAYTYIATAAAVVAVGATPVLAEIDESLGMDPDDVARKISPRTKAIIPVHMQGVPCRLGQLVELAARKQVMVIEDCCQCVGGTYNGKSVGTFGLLGAWSLNAFKVLTCGEGGLVFTNDYRLHERTAFAADPALPMWMKDTIPSEGWSEPPFSSQCYRPGEIQGALANVQLSRLPTLMAHMRSLKNTFLRNLAPSQVFKLQHVDDPAGDCGISAALIFSNGTRAAQYAQAITAEGVPCGAAYANAFPDRHVYRYWDSILDKRSHHPAMPPWGPGNSQQVSYSREMCPHTLDLLSRTLRFSFSYRMKPLDAQLMARAISKVDSALGPTFA